MFVLSMPLHPTLEQIDAIRKACSSCPHQIIKDYGYGLMLPYCTRYHTDSSVFLTERCKTLADQIGQ